MSVVAEEQSWASAGSCTLSGEQVVIVDSDRHAAWELARELHILTGCDATIATKAGIAWSMLPQLAPALAFLTVDAGAGGQQAVFVLRAATPDGAMNRDELELVEILDWPLVPDSLSALVHAIHDSGAEQ